MNKLIKELQLASPIIANCNETDFYKNILTSSKHKRYVFEYS